MSAPIATGSRGRWNRRLIYSLLLLAVAYTVFPVLWLVVNSFKTRLDIFAIPPI